MYLLTLIKLFMALCIVFMFFKVYYFAKCYLGFKGILYYKHRFKMAKKKKAEEFKNEKECREF